MGGVAEKNSAGKVEFKLRLLLLWREMVFTRICTESGQERPIRRHPFPFPFSICKQGNAPRLHTRAHSNPSLSQHNTRLRAIRIQNANRNRLSRLCPLHPPSTRISGYAVTVSESVVRRSLLSVDRGSCILGSLSHFRSLYTHVHILSPSFHYYYC